MKKVCSRTIAELTGEAARKDLSLASPVLVTPTVDDILGDLRANDPISAGQLESALKSIPPGFAAAPVLYTRIAKDKNRSIENEFSNLVRPAFMKYLGEHHAPALSALGICNHGIERMKKGFDPANTNNQRYEVNVDHIIERAGSGAYLSKRRVDAESGLQDPVYRVNHFANLMLMPISVHEYKNKLNDLQALSRMREGESRWAIMMVPVRDKNNLGYVCAAQGNVVPLRARQSNFMLNDLREAVLDAQSVITLAAANPVVVSAVREVDYQANKQRLSRGRFKALFNARVAKSPQGQELVNRQLRPAVAKVNAFLEKLDDYITGKGTKRDMMRANLRGFLAGRAFRDFEDRVKYFPMPETGDFLVLARRLRQHCEHGGQTPVNKAANGNAPAPKSGKKR